jgi:hypothetical protein
VRAERHRWGGREGGRERSRGLVDHGAVELGLGGRARGDGGSHLDSLLGDAGLGLGLEVLDGGSGGGRSRGRGGLAAVPVVDADALMDARRFSFQLLDQGPGMHLARQGARSSRRSPRGFALSRFMRIVRLDMGRECWSQEALSASSNDNELPGETKRRRVSRVEEKQQLTAAVPGGPKGAHLHMPSPAHEVPSR